MLLAEDFRAKAREALQGRWIAAALVGLLAALLGGAVQVNINYNIDSKDLESLRAIWNSGVLVRYLGVILGGGILSLAFGLVRLVIGGAVTLGYAQYNLRIIDHADARVDSLFAYFDHLWTGFCLQFLRWLYIFLWSLLFVIPGIIATYRYAMAAYILAEHPDMGANEAITASKEMMKGNKFRLFCLEFSFIGWGLLCSLPFLLSIGIVTSFMVGHVSHGLGAVSGLALVMGIGVLLSCVCTFFLQPYTETAIAAFYRDVSHSSSSDFSSQEDPVQGDYTYQIIP